MTFGLEPLPLLTLAPADFAVAAAALKKAEELRAARERGIADYAASKTASMTVRGISKVLAKMFSR